MSLYQTSLINIINQLNNGDMVLKDLKGKLSVDILDVITEYISMTNEDAFVKSSLEGNFQLADFFLNKTTNKVNTLLLTAKKLGENENIQGINYLIGKNIISQNKILNEALEGAAKNINRFNELTMMDTIEYLVANGANVNNGFKGAIAANNVELINWFIKSGANDINGGFIESVRANNKDLADFFFKNGADKLDVGLKIAAKNGNMVLVEYILNANPNILTTRSLGLAMDYGHANLIDTLVTSGHPLRNEINPICIGPRILDLLRQTKLQTQSGIDYSGLFTQAKQGIVLFRFIRFLPLLYVKQNGLEVEITRFIMDQTLNILFGEMPALNDYQGTMVSNIHGKSSIEVMLDLEPDFEITQTGEIEKEDFHELMICNIYENMVLSEIQLYSPATFAQLLRESKLLEAILRTYHD